MIRDVRSQHILEADPHAVKGRLMRDVLVTDPDGHRSVAAEVPNACAMDVLEALRREYVRGREDHGRQYDPPDRMGVSWGVIPDGAVAARNLASGRERERS